MRRIFTQCLIRLRAPSSTHNWTNQPTGFVLTSRKTKERTNQQIQISSGRENMLCISRLREGAQCRWPDHICKNRNPAFWGGEKYFFHPFGSAEAASVLLFEVLFEKCQRQNSCKWKFKKPSSPHLQHKKLGVCQGSTDVRLKSNQMLEYSTRYFYKMTGKAKRA